MIEDEEDVKLRSNFEEVFHLDDFEILSSHDLLLMSEKGHESQLEQIEVEDKNFDNQVISSIQQYEEEWNELFNNEEVDLEKLKQKSIKGLLRNSHFRSVCWRCLLGILHKQPKQWLCQLQMYRKHYDEVCAELQQNPWNAKASNPYDNPLSQESDSVWQKYFCDEELKAVVHQDVKRTFPGIDFFRKDDIQQMMVRVLFCYARQNPSLCYRQGMHEILAPLIFILHCDHQAFLHAKEQKLELKQNLGEILNPEYLEQDAYSIFKCVMNHVECSYRINNVTTSAGYFPPDCEKFENKPCQNELMPRLDFIKKNILHPKDEQLSDHLQKLNIPLHLFGIRWLRLLFGREFALQDLLVLWDFIFAYNFETVNFIVVAMLIAIRHVLIMGDYTDCLSNLMRYPNGVDVTYIVQYALYLKNPQLYPPPDSSRKSGFSYLSPKNKKDTHVQPHSDRSLKKEISRTPFRFPEKSSLHSVSEKGDGDNYISPSYSIDDPNYLKQELEQARLIINTAHQKLFKFYCTLKDNYQNNIHIDVQDVLDEIYGLSCLLRSHSKTNVEVETACEAGETKETKITNPEPPKLENLKPSTSVNSDPRSHAGIKRPLKSGELKVFKQHTGGTMNGAPMADPLHLLKI